MSDSLTQDERDTIRADAECALIITLRAVADDCESVIEQIAGNNVPLDVVGDALYKAEDAATAIRTLRDEYEMSIRADAHAGLALL